jgi:hypothetical protein
MFSIITEYVGLSKHSQCKEKDNGILPLIGIEDDNQHLVLPKRHTMIMLRE